MVARRLVYPSPAADCSNGSNYQQQDEPRHPPTTLRRNAEQQNSSQGRASTAKPANLLPKRREKSGIPPRCLNCQYRRRIPARGDGDAGRT